MEIDVVDFEHRYDRLGWLRVPKHIAANPVDGGPIFDAYNVGSDSQDLLWARAGLVRMAVDNGERPERRKSLALMG